jgi:nucleotide-binding universal stress UspA family protein
VTSPPNARPGTGPVVIGYDGSAAAQRALVEGAALLAPRRALVVVVWEAGRAYESAEWNAITLDLPAPTVDLRMAIEVDRAVAEAAERTAQRGVELARAGGLEAEGMVVADTRGIAETLIRVASDEDAAALVVGAHRQGALGEVLLGSTSRDVLRSATCPVVVVRDDARRRDGG